MQRLFEYVGHHPYLASGVIAIAVALAVYEIRARLQAFAALSAMQVVRLMNQGALLLDLRSKQAFDAGHIGDARNVPVAELEASADTLKKWHDKHVITYDDTGAGAAGAVRTLTKLGFSKVSALEGGVNGWLKDNLPLTKPASGARASLK